MTRQPDDKGERPQRKVSELNKKDRTMGGGIRQYATFGGILAIIVLLAVIAFKLIQSPQAAAPTQVAAVATNTPPEVATIQALETNAALLVTPSVDPNVAALQTQNAILIQNSTNQAATSQATLSQPTETPQPTQVPATVQPSQVPPTAVPPTSTPVVVVVTATPLPTVVIQPTADRPVATVASVSNPVNQSCLPKADFVAIINKWHQVDQGNPSPAISDLDAKFDQSDGSIGEQWSTAPYTITLGSSGSVVFWTNTLNKPLNKVTASGVIEKIFLTGGYGIYAAWDTDVSVPTPGRSAWLCEPLDPAHDFSWWGK